jgi:hypothetical protein
VRLLTFLGIYSASYGFETKSVAHTAHVRMVGCVVNNEVEKICKEAVVGYFYVLLSRIFPGGTESLWSVTRP